VDRPPYNPPADAASGFVGYYTVSEKATTCGNCHAEKQAKWVETRHADATKALTDLPAGSTTPACFSCHAVTSNGNAKVTPPAGYDKVADSTYHDVQCESCHGPGQQHIESVNAGSIVRPLARIAVLPDTTAGCAACHRSTHAPFLEQWRDSRHGQLRASQAGNASCNRCHEGRGALQSWGIQPTWAEGPWAATPAANLQPQVCSTCHDPHGGPNSYQTRFPISSTDETQNLCIKCHNNRAQPVAGSSRGNQPHGPQGGMLLGFAGYRTPNFVYDTARIYGSHATTANPDLCAGCHVQRQTITDPSGKFQFQSVGHLFKPIPCLDAQGNPTGDDSCAFTTTARSWVACTKSGCHANATVAASAFNTTKSEIQFLVDALWKDKDGDKSIDAYPTDDGYLPRIKLNAPADLNPSDAIVTAADGCEFNSRTTGGLPLADHPDGSYGTHNAFLYRALLTSCTSYLKSIYAFLPAPPANVQSIMDRWDAPVMGNAPVIARVPLPAADH
jgi:predicted CXXCH cytochrome family protein